MWKGIEEFPVLREFNFQTREEGTEAFPDLGAHCQHSGCNRLEILPFKCDGCLKVFCSKHRSFRSHKCSNPNDCSRQVVVCETCSMSIEIPPNTRGAEDEKALILARHEKSGDCDPQKKKKPTCGFRQCQKILTFFNTATCKSCHINFCLEHRFPDDHACKTNQPPMVVAAKRIGADSNNNFLAALASRSDQDCTKKGPGSALPSKTNPSLRAY